MAEHLYRKPGRIQPAMGHSNVDDLVSKNVLAQLKRDPPPKPPDGHHGRVSAAGNHNGGVETSDLVASMAKRLGALERELKERAALLQQMQADNVALKGKLKVAEEEIAKRALSAIEPKDESSAAVMHLRAENARLRSQLKYAWKQVGDMKAFLNDYGMVWVGEPEAERQLAAAEAGAFDEVSSPKGLLPRGQVLGGGPAAPPPTRLAPLGPVSPPVPTPPAAPRPDPLPAAAAAARRTSHSGATTSGLQPVPPSVQRSTSFNRNGGSGSPRSSAATLGSSPLGGSAAAAAGGGAGAGHPHIPAPAASPPAPAPLPSAPAGGAGSSAPSQKPSRPCLPVPIAELKSKLDELNQIAGDGCGHLVKDSAGQHVLSTPMAVFLAVFKDGLQIHTLPARPYNDSSSQTIIRDILDGYFPYVLKKDFPDGVPIRLLDRSSESIDSVLSAPGASAAGAGNIRSWQDIEAQGAGGSGDPVSKDKFLSRLPQAVIKNGKVIDIKGEIGKLLSAPDHAANGERPRGDVALVATPVDALLSTIQRNHVGPSLPPPSRDSERAAAASADVTTLQVKSEDGKQTYVLKFKYDDTIGTLRACIDSHRAKLKPPVTGAKYEIRSAFPARAYTDPSETLRTAGLIPNATLFLRALQ